MLRLVQAFEKKNRLFVWLVFGLATVLLFTKMFIVTWMAMTDETLNTAMSYRFFLGDIPLVDDWSPEQLHGLVILPLVATFVFLTKSTDGIILFIRICYFVIKFIVAIWALLKLKNRNMGLFSTAAVLMWYFFAPYNVECLTYQATPPILLFIMIIILINDNVSNLGYLVVGILYSLVVLSQPFWVISFIPIMGYLLINKKKYWRSTLWFIGGIMFVFFIFCIFILSRSTIGELKANIPYIFSEPDHNMASESMWSLVYTKVLLVFKEVLTYNWFSLLINGIYIIVLTVLKVRKRNIERLRIFMPVCLILSICSLTYYHVFVHWVYMMNDIFIPFIWAGIENMFFEYENKKYIHLFLLTLLLPVTRALGTNIGGYAVPESLSSLMVVVLLFMDDSYLSEHRKELLLVTGIMAFICVFSLVLRVYSTWGGQKISSDNFKNQINDGPMKHMRVEDKYYKMYYDMHDAIERIADKDSGILLCGNYTPLAYLDAQMRYGTMGVPFFYMDYDRLEEYYRLHEDKRPTVIYYYKSDEFFYLPYEDAKSTFLDDFLRIHKIYPIGDSVIIGDNLL